MTPSAFCCGRSGDRVNADPTYADAILDRLVHNAHRIDLAGESLTRESLTRRRSRSIQRD